MFILFLSLRYSSLCFFDGRVESSKVDISLPIVLIVFK